MNIAIHDSPGGFSDRWLSVCRDRGLPVRKVNCLASDVVAQCKDVDVLLWNFLHGQPREDLLARSVVHALEASGVLVFPNVATSWHYDDKVAQKYLLEAINAPLIPTWVFTSREEALIWIASATWPKVFKLRCGAGSRNVQLVRSRSEAIGLCRRAFGRGFAASAGYFADMRTRLRNTKDRRSFWAKVRRAPQVFLNNLMLRRVLPRQRGYVYFQEFLPGNQFDTRITVVGERAFGFIRQNRPGDFRASGSGLPLYERERIDTRCVTIAFNVAKLLGAQSLAFDFLFDANGAPRIGEVSYCYVAEAVHQCPGHWDRDLRWVEGRVWPQDAILEDLLASRATAE